MTTTELIKSIRKDMNSKLGVKYVDVERLCAEMERLQVEPKCPKCGSRNIEAYHQATHPARWNAMCRMCRFASHYQTSIDSAINQWRNA